MDKAIKNGIVTQGLYDLEDKEKFVLQNIFENVLVRSSWNDDVNFRDTIL